MTLSREQNSKESQKHGYDMKKAYINMIPLAEIVARGLGISTLTAKKVYTEYCRIVALTQSECELWSMDEETIIDVLKGNIPDNIYNIILSIKRGEFGFYPPGFDGQYGQFVLGESSNMHDLCEITSP